MQGQASSPQIKRADLVDRKKRLEFSVLHTYLPIASSSLVTSPELAVQDPSCREGTADPLRPVPSVRVHRSRRSRKEPIWKADRIASRPQRITPFTAQRTRSVSGSDLVSSDWACWRWVSRYCLTVFRSPTPGLACLVGGGAIAAFSWRRCQAALARLSAADEAAGANNNRCRGGNAPVQRSRDAAFGQQ